MSKKAKKSKKRGSQATKQAEAPFQPPADSPEEHNPFDFGGLPQRDLKKNLGCG
jgi:hypothetical protein